MIIFSTFCLDNNSLLYNCLNSTPYLSAYIAKNLSMADFTYSFPKMLLTALVKGANSFCPHVI